MTVDNFMWVMVLYKMTADHSCNMQVFTVLAYCRYMSFENNIVFLKKIPPQGSTVQRYSQCQGPIISSQVT